MLYLLDTNAIIRYFTGFSKITSKAKRVIQSAESYYKSLAISVVSLMEIMYLSEKKKIPLNLVETLAIVEKHPAYFIVDLNVDILLLASKINFYELHDRLIIATALNLKCPIISSDKKFKNVKGLKVIW